MPGASFLTRYLAIQVTTPANTAESSPVTTLWDLGNVELETLWVIIPSGHAGLTGIGIEYETVRIVPFGDPVSWIISDDEDIVFEINAEVGNPIGIVTYNEDIYDHSFHLRAKIRSLDVPTDEGMALELPDFTGGG